MTIEKKTDTFHNVCSLMGMKPKQKRNRKTLFFLRSVLAFFQYDRYWPSVTAAVSCQLRAVGIGVAEGGIFPFMILTK